MAENILDLTQEELTRRIDKLLKPYIPEKTDRKISTTVVLSICNMVRIESNKKILSHLRKVKEFATTLNDIQTNDYPSSEMEQDIFDDILATQLDDVVNSAREITNFNWNNEDTTNQEGAGDSE